MKAGRTAWAEPQSSHQGSELHLNGPFLLFIQVGIKSSLIQVPAWNFLQPLYKSAKHIVLLIHNGWVFFLAWMEIIYGKKASNICICQEKKKKDKHSIPLK